MKRAVRTFTVILALGVVACNHQNESSPEMQKADPNPEQITDDMKSFVALFEIPAMDISRAINFYQSILDIDIEKMEIPGIEMGVFPYQGQVVTGVIMKGDGYVPSSGGVTIYLNGGEDLQPILDKVESNGGEILIPKTAHADESGFFALFLDSEGNKMGLDSPN